MEHRPFGRTGLDVSAVGYGCWEIGGGYGDIEEAEFVRAVGRALDLGINCFDTAEGYGMGASERALGAGARPPARRGDHRHQVRHELPRQAEPPRQQPRARDRVDRQDPEEPRHRLRRRLPRALARPEHAVRGDDERARRRRARRQGAVRRPLELQARRDRGVHGRAARRRRAVRLEHVRPPHAAARSSRTAQEHGVGFMAYGSLAFGLLTGTFTEDHDFGSADWRARQGNMGAIKMFAALFGPEKFKDNVRAVNELKGIAATLRQEPPAARAALGDLAPGRQHRARRLPYGRRGRGQRRRRRLVDQRRRPRRDRRDLRPPRRRHHPRLLDRRRTWARRRSRCGPVVAAAVRDGAPEVAAA